MFDETSRTVVNLLENGVVDWRALRRVRWKFALKLSLNILSWYGVKAEDEYAFSSPFSSITKRANSRTESLAQSLNAASTGLFVHQLVDHTGGVEQVLFNSPRL